MYDYDYIRNANRYFQPRTPAAAARAVEATLTPIEALVYTAGNIGPLSEEPYDYDAIERVLAGTHLDLETNLFLLSVFEKLIKHEDPEIALFAAESINTIENRYNKEIEDHQELLSQVADPESLRKLAGLFYELAMVNRSRTTIKNFYLKESYSCYRSLEAEEDLNSEDIVKAVRILIELHLYGEARQVVQKQNPKRDDVDLLVLEAEINFSAGETRRVFPVITELSLMRERLDEITLSLVSDWLAV